MLARLILWAVNGPHPPGSLDRLQPDKQKSALRWWIEDRVWSARLWAGDKLLVAADRLHGVGDEWAGFPIVEQAPAVVPDPPPLVVTSPPVQTYEQWCDAIAEWRLARDIADHFELDFGQVWTCLGTLPANQANLLDSPQGGIVRGMWQGGELAASARE